MRYIDIDTVNLRRADDYRIFLTCEVGAHARKYINDRPVGLQRTGLQPHNAHTARNRARNKEKRGLRIIALHLNLLRVIFLSAAYMKPVALGPYLHTETAQHIERQIHVPARLKAADHIDRRIPVQQRQRKKQPRHELRAYTPIQPEAAGFYRARHTQRQIRFIRSCIGNPLLIKYLQIRIDGPLRQPPAPGKRSLPVICARHGDHEAQRGTRFRAVNHRAVLQAQPAAYRNRAAVFFLCDLRFTAKPRARVQSRTDIDR